jgi:hypothetical protein
MKPSIWRMHQHWYIHHCFIVSSHTSQTTNLIESESDELRIRTNPNLSASSLGRIRVYRNRGSVESQSIGTKYGRVQILIGLRSNPRTWFGFGTYLRRIRQFSTAGPRTTRRARQHAIHVGSFSSESWTQTTGKANAVWTLSVTKCSTAIDPQT